MEPVNVMHVVRPAEGGIRVHVRCLLQYTDHDRFNLMVACPDMPGMVEDFRLPGIRFFPVNLRGEFRPRMDWLCAKTLQRLMVEQQVQVVHAHGAKAGLIGRLAARWAGVPLVVVTAHNFIADSAVPVWQKTIYNKVNRYLAKHTDQLIAVSQALARHMVEVERVAPDRVTAIPNGVDLTRFLGMVDCGKKRKELGLDPQFPIVGVVARLIPQKGVGLFLRAAVLIREKMPFAQFLIVGDGPQRPMLEHLARDLGIERFTVFAGWRDDVPCLLPVINVLVIPSTSEGFSITALEAMAARRPVVAFAVGGLTEVVVHGETGLLVPAGNYRLLAGAVLEMLAYPLRAERMGRRARQAVEERFEVRSAVGRTQELYVELLRRKGLFPAFSHGRHTSDIDAKTDG